jgi:superfamily II DNA or RNA helicase
MQSIARLSFSRGTLVLEGMLRGGIERVFQTPWLFDARAGLWRCDALHYARVRQELRERCHGFDDALIDPETIAWPKIELPPLRSDQQAAAAAWRRSDRGVIVMPTGTGKTEVALTLMAEKSIATLVVAPVRDLMYQWHRRIFKSFGYDAGVIGDGRHDVRAVSVTTYESACIHMERLGDRFGLIIFDECHHLPGRVRSDAARMCCAPCRLGLTATPDNTAGPRADMEFLIGPVVHEMPITEARGRTLADYEVFRIPVHLSDQERWRYDRVCGELRQYVAQRKRSEPDFNWQKLCSASRADPSARRATGDREPRGREAARARRSVSAACRAAGDCVRRFQCHGARRVVAVPDSVPVESLPQGGASRLPSRPGNRSLPGDCRQSRPR